MPDRIVEYFDIDASGAVRGGRQAEDALQRVNGVVRGADGKLRDAKGRFVGMGEGMDQAGGAAGRLQGRLSSLGAAIKGFIVAQALQMVAAYTMRLFELGTASQETASKFDTVFGPASARLRGEIGAVANQMGLTRTEAEGFAATLGAMAQGFDLSQGASAQFANQVLRLAGDLTSFSNVPIEETLAAIQSGLTGEQEPLRRFGILLNDAAVKAKAAQQTGRALSSEFTEQEKVMARLALITEKAGVANGDLSRTADSAANTSRRLSAELRDQEQVFAQLLIPTFNLTLETLGQIINENKSAAGSFSVTLARGILVGTNALLGVVRAGIQTGRALFRLGQVAEGTGVGPGSPFGRMLFGLEGISAALNVATVATNFLSNGLRGVVLASAQLDLFQARNRKRGAIARGDIEAAKEYQLELERATAEVARLSTQIQETRADSGVALRQIRDTFFGAPEGAGAKLTPFSAAAQELEGMVANLADVGGEFSKLGDAIDGVGNDLALATEEASDKMRRAREKARREEEQRRRLEIDRQFELDGARIAAMEDGTDKAIAEIELGGRRELEAYRRTYGEAPAEIVALQRRRLDRDIEDERRGVRVRVNQLRIEINQALAEAIQAAIAPFVTQSGTEMQNAVNAAMLELVQPLTDFAPLVVSETAIAGDAFEQLVVRIRGLAGDLRTDFGGTLESLGGIFGTLEQTAGDFYQASGRESEKAFRNQKRFAVAQAIISTLVAANNALADVRPFPLNIAAAAAILGAGYARVSAINAAEPGRGGSRGGSGGGRSSSGNASSLSAGLSVGAGMSAGQTAGQGQSAAPNVTVNNGQPVVVVENRTTPEGFATTVRTGQRRIAQSRGSRAGLGQ